MIIEQIRMLLFAVVYEEERIRLILRPLPYGLRNNSV